MLTSRNACENTESLNSSVSLMSAALMNTSMFWTGVWYYANIVNSF